MPVKIKKILEKISDLYAEVFNHIKAEYKKENKNPGEIGTDEINSEMIKRMPSGVAIVSNSAYANLKIIQEFFEKYTTNAKLQAYLRSFDASLNKKI